MHTTHGRERLSRRHTIESFRCETCPSCGKAKTKLHAFCSFCFARLPSDLRNRLGLNFGAGFEEAWTEGLECLALRFGRRLVYFADDVARIAPGIYLRGLSQYSGKRSFLPGSIDVDELLELNDLPDTPDNRATLEAAGRQCAAALGHPVPADGDASPAV